MGSMIIPRIMVTGPPLVIRGGGKASTPPRPRRRQRGAAPLQLYGASGRSPQRVLTAVLPVLGTTSTDSFFVAGLRTMSQTMTNMSQKLVQQVDWVSPGCLKPTRVQYFVVLYVHLLGPMFLQKLAGVTGMTAPALMKGPMVVPFVNDAGLTNMRTIVNQDFGSNGHTAPYVGEGVGRVAMMLLELELVAITSAVMSLGLVVMAS